MEICFNEEWGTVCADNFWRVLDANVVCGELGFSSAGISYAPRFLIRILTRMEEFSYGACPITFFGQITSLQP